MIIPELVEYAREYFNCPTLTGVELEDEGSRTNSSFSHWEKRIIDEDVMVGNINLNAGISMFSLIMLNSTGWYKIDKRLAHNTKWGYKAGC